MNKLSKASAAMSTKKADKAAQAVEGTCEEKEEEEEEAKDGDGSDSEPEIDEDVECLVSAPPPVFRVYQYIRVRRDVQP